MDPPSYYKLRALDGLQTLIRITTGKWTIIATCLTLFALHFISDDRVFFICQLLNAILIWRAYTQHKIACVMFYIWLLIATRIHIYGKCIEILSTAIDFNSPIVSGTHTIPVMTYNQWTGALSQDWESTVNSLGRIVYKGFYANTVDDVYGRIMRISYFDLPAFIVCLLS